ncbi:MAG: hypothetical protein V4523_08050 [Pseudomonadota bacterium]
MRRTPLAKKRATPRRDEGRVRHERIKDRGRFPTEHVKRYWETLERRCVSCGRSGETVIHHILARLSEKLRQRDHRFVVMLCPGCHNMSDTSVHMLGSEAAFHSATGIDLVEIACANWSKYDG